MPVRTSARRRITKTQLRRKVRARAPKHPKGPEAHLRHALVKLFDAYHGKVKARFLEVARHRRRDAQEPAAEHGLASVFHDLWSEAMTLLHTSAFKRIVEAVAKATAASVTAQTKSALDLDEHAPDLAGHVRSFADDLTDRAADLMGESIQRGSDVLEEWSGLTDRSERYEDVDALDDILDDGLDGIGGKALAAGALAFGSMFGDMVKSSQTDAGVASAMWHSQLDSHVRETHRALDGEVFQWDDAPLKAVDSDSGDDCFPGDDYGCRCTADPVTDEEAELLQ